MLLHCTNLLFHLPLDPLSFSIVFPFIVEEKVDPKPPTSKFARCTARSVVVALHLLEVSAHNDLILTCTSVD